MHKCWIASRLLLFWELPTGFWRSEPQVSSPEDDYDGSTGTGPIPPAPDSRRAKLGPVRSISREDLGRGRLGCPTLESAVAGRPARRHATQRRQSAPIPPQRLKTGRCESGEGGYFGLSQTPATRRSAPGHAESRAKLLDDEGQPKKDQTKGSEGPTCRPP